MGPEVPCTAKKVFGNVFSRHLHRNSPPINFSALVAVLQNNVTDRFIDNHIFSECQELSSFLKVAQPFGTFKIFRVGAMKFPIVSKNGNPFLGLSFIEIS